MNKELVRDRINNCKAVAWDTCHKIYIVMDEEEVKKMEEYGYTAMLLSEFFSPDIMYRAVMEWYKKSCALKFINAVGSPDIFETLVGQFDESYDEDYCTDCNSPMIWCVCNDLVTTIDKETP